MRCRPDYFGSMKTKNNMENTEDYHRIETAIKYLEENYRDHPNLEQIAASACLSKYHFQRLFKRWAGISPSQFLGYLTLDYAKRSLAESKDLLDTSYGAGLSGPGRLHDLFVTYEAVTPGQYKQMGERLTIEYGFHPTRFGECLIGITERGICHLGFVTDNRDSALALLRQKWPKASIVQNRDKTEPYAEKIFNPDYRGDDKPFHLLLKGTNFQINVWKALLTIPEGRMVSYRDIALSLGKAQSYRAAASAIAVNSIGYLIPCHRVIAKSGRFHRYRWGTSRKKIICAWEASRVNRS